MDPYNNPNTTKHQRHRSSSTTASGSGSGGGGSGGGDGDTKKEKKVLHRNIERQRRQEMATHFASLRSHLPLQYIKGKRAISEHVNGAVNFIKDTQTRINNLTARRDELRREIDPSFSNPSQTRSGSGSNRSDPATVLVQPCLKGVELVVSSAVSGHESWPLSRVLEILHQQGLEVISSLTTRVNERLMYTIQVQVNSFSFDLAWLQQKLIEELNKF